VQAVCIIHLEMLLKTMKKNKSVDINFKKVILFGHSKQPLFYWSFLSLEVL